MKRNKSLVNYLINISLRICYIHKKLKDTGSFYLHCDPTASHYLKIVLDYIFGMGNFRNEIVWCYSTGKYCNKDFAKKHDIIFRYAKSNNYTFNKTKETCKNTIKESSISQYNKEDENGNLYREIKGKKYYIDNFKTQISEDYWVNIPILKTNNLESLRYPTQKPEALLERIIQASSNEGDLIADFYLGGGTTAAVCKKLNRNFIGCDISELSIKTVNNRLNL